MRSNKARFKIINVNDRSILNKFVEFERVLIEHGPNVVIITETWLNHEIRNVEIVSPGCNILRKDREESRGDGVAIIARNYMDCTKIQGASGIANIWCRIKLNCSEMVVKEVHRPPEAPINFLAALNKVLVKLNSNSRKIVIAGHLNLQDIN